MVLMDWSLIGGPLIGAPIFGGRDHQQGPGPMPAHGPALPPPAQMVDQPGQPHQSVRDRYQSASYATLGMTEAEFNSMDPIERNTRINAAYAQMYMDNQDTMKWAGMAA